ncbi:MAG TPA: 3-hydroxybutyryl-CoA dehydrogenase [Thermodesulfobacteriota bacterium]|nr:3-hydroxybutyryl-CoA dehydrogenase [Thermodesulfobacteriota bacterium]
MIKKVGVVGCGAMGSGIAQVVLESGYNVVVREIDASLLDKGIKAIQKGLERSVAKGVLATKTKEEALARLSGSVALEDLKGCDLVIEAVFEDIRIKKELFKNLDSICPKETIFASNTSSLSITEMASATTRQERVVGLHFFNPVQVMALVEVIKTIVTPDEISRMIFEFVKSLKKVPILAKDNSGFIVNLLLTPYLMDAIRAVATGVASVQDIDTGMKLGCGYPMGPLMLADFIGLDILFKGTTSMFEEYKDSRYAPPPLLIQLVRMGYIGRKVGKGFYDWSDPKNPVPQDIF